MAGSVSVSVTVSVAKTIIEIVEDRMRRAAAGEDIGPTTGMTYGQWKEEQMTPTLNVPNVTGASARRDRELAPPQQLSIGSIVTLRMRGHTRTNGLEYFAPAVVLAQHTTPDGEIAETIEALVWDPTAGTHYNPAYQVRELSTRPSPRGGVEMYEVQSNIQSILFSPERFMQIGLAVDLLADQIASLSQRVAALEYESHLQGDLSGEGYSGKLVDTVDSADPGSDKTIIEVRPHATASDPKTARSAVKDK